MKILFLAACATVVLIASPSQATVINLHAEFTASNFDNGASYDPITGNLDFAFDNAASFTGTTAGLTINAFTLAAAGYPVKYAYFQPDDLLLLGDNPSLAGCVYNIGTDGFCTFIYNASTAPHVDFFNYTSTLTTAVHGVQSYDFSTGNTAAVPEPATWAMMIGGLGLVGAALRRRTQRARLNSRHDHIAMAG